MSYTATQEARRRGMPRWAEQAAKAEAMHAALLNLLNIYNQHADAANSDTGNYYPTARLMLVPEQQSAWLTDVVKATHS